MEKKIERVFRTCKQKILSLEGGGQNKMSKHFSGPQNRNEGNQKKCSRLPTELCCCVYAISFYYTLQYSNVSVRDTIAVIYTPTWDITKIVILHSVM